MQWKYTKQRRVYTIKIDILDKKTVVGWAFLYVLFNDRHQEPFGFLENVYVEQEYRGQGLGTELVKRVIEEAKKQGCYKLIGTSRNSKPEVHAFYEQSGFKPHGVEFRMNLKKSKIKQRD